ncbi:ABC transporter ATP-binding protein [Coraliomargarita akajimensis]|uniref:ABC transporter related protein n=1 Tax=Coraliomargarita akajimensis (strain DSM 45221 / IAM 15411 / JCM 23193 / KCTC 12865 / 04OKA010-24) TaxID=583355 RepID=D5EIP9_CORAD|nr:ABC transporter ATP-binding protein [Coraliomargarita akajimensis]ADE54298.1 ABC transporter related protein [Coraliomargarita akajimensis DSM 45221]
MSDFLLEAKGITKSFPSPDGAIEVLKGLDFQLGCGASVSIRGESGSGKSTFLNVLSGLEVATTGELFWAGEKVSRRSLSWMAAKRSEYMGFVFQAYYLAPELNALENVLLGARIAGKLNAEIQDRAVQLMERVGMGHRLRHPATKLSGGERQRVAVARALINDPPLILADEPTGNLDEATGHAVMDLLLELVAEASKSLVLVTHNPEFAARTDQQLTLHYGSFE